MSLTTLSSAGSGISDVSGMDVISFFEKPGCLTNKRQKNLLRRAGHTLEVRNLLLHPWTAAELLAYFGERPVSEWFNLAAPSVKGGVVDPHALSAEAALALLLDDHLLIRRPLLLRGDKHLTGFDAEALRLVLGVVLPAEEGASADAQGCSSHHHPCPEPLADSH